MSSEAQRVRIIEDDKPLRTTLSATLKAEGYHPLEAGSVAAARQRLREHADAMILDLGLPDADGLTFLSERRSAGDLTRLSS